MRASPGRSPTRSRPACERTSTARPGGCSMLETAARILSGETAYVVGGTVRDELLGRPILDVDIACREPERAARAYANEAGGAPFPLSAAHGGWRVALGGGLTVDFTPLLGTIEDDLATRDFTINAVARPLAGGDHVD